MSGAVDITITVSVRLKPWARIALWLARALCRVAGRLASFAVDHGIEVRP